MGTFVRFLGMDGLPVWGEVERSGEQGDVSGRLLSALPSEHHPDYFARLLRAMDSGGAGETFHIESAMILPPVSRPPAILAIGMNYQDHLDENNAALAAAGKPTIPQPTEPTLFAKFPASVVGHEDAIVLPHIAPNQVDYEAELAVVIGRDVRDVAPADALRCVAFYTCGHDVSARDAQLSAPNGQWVRGKSFDTFCPLGPVAVRDIDPSGRSIRLLHNGAPMQMSNTANLIFPVEALISYLSHNMTLLAGTVILTGTPGGVGHFLDPPVYLKPGDVVEVEIDGIGTLRNPVAADPYSGWTPTTRFAARGSTPSAGPEEGQDE